MTRPDYVGSPPTAESVRRGRIAIAGLVGITVLAGLTYLWVSRDTGAERWTEFPRTLSCAPDRTGVAPTADVLDSVELRHLERDRLVLTVTFAEAPSTSTSFSFIVKDPAARDAVVVYRSPGAEADSRTGGWAARSQADLVRDTLAPGAAGAANALESASVSGTTAVFTVNMAAVGGALTDTPFRPSVQANVSVSPGGGRDDVLLATQTCQWDG